MDFTDAAAIRARASRVGRRTVFRKGVWGDGRGPDKQSAIEERFTWKQLAANPSKL